MGFSPTIMAGFRSEDIIIGNSVIEMDALNKLVELGERYRDWKKRLEAARASGAPDPTLEIDQMEIIKIIAACHTKAEVMKMKDDIGIAKEDITELRKLAKRAIENSKSDKANRLRKRDFKDIDSVAAVILKDIANFFNFVADRDNFYEKHRSIMVNISKVWESNKELLRCYADFTGLKDYDYFESHYSAKAIGMSDEDIAVEVAEMQVNIKKSKIRGDKEAAEQAAEQFNSFTESDAVHNVSNKEMMDMINSIMKEVKEMKFEFQASKEMASNEAKEEAKKEEAGAKSSISKCVRDLIELIKQNYETVENEIDWKAACGIVYEELREYVKRTTTIPDGFREEYSQLSLAAERDARTPDFCMWNLDKLAEKLEDKGIGEMIANANEHINWSKKTADIWNEMKKMKASSKGNEMPWNEYADKLEKLAEMVRMNDGNIPKIIADFMVPIFNKATSDRKDLRRELPCKFEEYCKTMTVENQDSDTNKELIKAFKAFVNGDACRTLLVGEDIPVDPRLLNKFLSLEERYEKFKEEEAKQKEQNKKDAESSAKSTEQAEKSEQSEKQPKTEQQSEQPTEEAEQSTATEQNQQPTGDAEAENVHPQASPA